MGETRYYEVGGAPVVWRAGEFPKVVETGSYIYNFEKVARRAKTISRDQFERLVASIGTGPLS